MTKYIEEHNFNFDNVFDERADNNNVRNIQNCSYIQLFCRSTKFVFNL